MSAALARVSAPATALIVTALLGIVVNLLIAGLYAIIFVLLLTGSIPSIGSFDQDPMQLLIAYGVVVAAAVFGLVMDVLVLAGAARMKRLESYRFALAASIIAAIPGISPCCLLGVPFGIWAIVVLSDDSVKAAFQGRTLETLQSGD